MDCSWDEASWTTLSIYPKIFKFKAPVKIGDTVKATVEVIEKWDDKKMIRLKTKF